MYNTHRGASWCMICDAGSVADGARGSTLPTGINARDRRAPGGGGGGLRGLVGGLVGEGGRAGFIDAVTEIASSLTNGFAQHAMGRLGMSPSMVGGPLVVGLVQAKLALYNLCTPMQVDAAVDNDDGAFQRHAPFALISPQTQAYILAHCFVATTRLRMFSPLAC